MGQAAREVVMVVEDDPDTRDALCEALNLYGYQAMSAENGEEALKILRASPRPCIILLDMMLPVMDGWEFRQIQSADPTLSSIPVVCVTAAVGAERRAADAGFVGFYSKPVQVDALISTIREYC